uniref:DUF2254 domain-containing protein n=1 Tax=Bursaphelenchus xylophilus TaxID=6326 RepID=A0A1I7SGT6_BURXY
NAHYLHDRLIICYRVGESEGKSITILFQSLQLAKKHGGFAKVSKLLDLKDRLFSVPTNDPLGPRLHAYIDVLVEIRAILKSRHASDVELIYLDESITVLRAIRHSPRHEKAVKILDYIMKQLHHDLTGEQAMVKFSMAIVAAYSAGEEVNLNPTDLIMDMADSVMRVPLNFLADKYNEMAFSVRRIDDTLDKSGNETRRPIKDLINLLPIVMY